MLSSLVAAYAWILLAIGLLGGALGVNRTIKSRDEESKALQFLSFFGGLIMMILPICIVLQGSRLSPVSPLTLLLMLLLGISLNARPLKNIPITFIIVIGAGIILFGLALQFSHTAMAGDIPMTTVAVLMLAVLGGVFAVSFVVENTLDVFLSILSWGPLVTIISLAAVLQGILIGTGITGPHGFFHFIR